MRIGLNNINRFKCILACKKNRLVVYSLLMIGFYLMQHVMAGHAVGAELPNEQKLKDLEKKDDAKAGGRWLPIPIFLTEPAFGYGLGLALGYIHPKKDDTEKEGSPSVQTLKSATSGRSGQKPPPTITGVAGGYTEKDTWAVAIGHSTSWRKDTIRYKGGLAYADVKSEFYILDRPIDFNLKGAGLYQDLKFRLGNSRVFLGGKLLILETESQFK